MAPILNPYTLLALQWVVSRGAPVLVRRFTSTPAEPARFEGDATLQRGGESISGLLSITDRHLVFTPNAAADAAPWILPLVSVQDVAPVPRRLLWIIPLSPRAIRVDATSGIYRFGVEGSDLERWLLEIRRATFLGT